MKMTLNPPKGTGYFWWTNGGEHTPTILLVVRYGAILYASNGEYSFTVSDEPVISEKEDDDDEPRFSHEGKEYYFETELWSEQPIELPEIDGEFVLPNSF